MQAHADLRDQMYQRVLHCCVCLQGVQAWRAAAGHRAAGPRPRALLGAAAAVLLERARGVTVSPQLVLERAFAADTLI
jgi:hypothetical protein